MTPLEIDSNKISKTDIRKISNYLLIFGVLWLFIIVPLFLILAETTELLKGVANGNSIFYAMIGIGCLPFGVSYLARQRYRNVILTAMHILVGIIIPVLLFAVVSQVYIVAMFSYHIYYS